MPLVHLDLDQFDLVRNRAISTLCVQSATVSRFKEFRLVDINPHTLDGPDLVVEDVLPAVFNDVNGAGDSVNERDGGERSVHFTP